MNKTIFTTGILFGFLAVVLGAFGAHGLEKVLDSSLIDTFNTGVTYQMYHALLATNTLTNFDFRTIALVTPLGGTLLISGWILLGFRYLKDFN